MATLQIRVDDNIKQKADTLFSGLGLDTSTAIRIFLNASIENNGIPFPVVHNRMSDEMLEAIEDTRLHRNLSKSYNTAEKAIRSALNGD